MPLNTEEEILEAQKGNKEAMQNIIQKNNGLVWSIVKRFGGRGHEIEDLYQIGAMGFIKAINKFDLSYGVQLSTYAVPYILGEIKRFIRDDGTIKVSRSIKELGIKIKELEREHLNKTGEEITINEISKALKIPKEEIAVAIDAGRQVESIDEEIFEDESSGETRINKISNGKDEADMIATRLTIKNLITNLDTREKQIIILRYYKEKTQTDVAKILGISQVQISRIEKKILENMKTKMVS